MIHPTLLTSFCKDGNVQQQQNEQLAPVVDPGPPPPPAWAARLTVTRQAAFQERNEEPQAFEGAFSRELVCKDGAQPATRRFECGEEWQPLCPEWFPPVLSLIMLRNLEGKFTQLTPTPEVRTEAMARVIELGAADVQNNPVPFAQVLPGTSLPGFEPVAGVRLFVRSRHGRARFLLTAIPA